MAHVTSDPEMAPCFACAASPHPSITLEEGVYGGITLDLMKTIKCPTLLMPATGDPDDYRAGLTEYRGPVYTFLTLDRRLVIFSSSCRFCHDRLPLDAAWFF
jgi:hypothetical protein